MKYLVLISTQIFSFDRNLDWSDLIMSSINAVRSLFIVTIVIGQVLGEMHIAQTLNSYSSQ